MAFGKKSENVKSKPASFDTPSTPQETLSVIGRTLLIKGEFNSDEEVLVEGRIEGKLNINNRVIVGRNGIVDADIEAREVIIKGIVNGNVKGTLKVEIIPEGTLNGNIISQRVKLADGAIFKGNIDMTPVDENKQVTTVLTTGE